MASPCWRGERQACDEDTAKKTAIMMALWVNYTS